MQPIIYLDNAATTWPKPDEIFTAMENTIRKAVGNPGRGSHNLTIAAGNILYDARETAAHYFGCEDPFRLIFTSGITESLNLVLQGFLNQGDRVLVSPMEHNSVMRPLSFLKERGISFDTLPADTDGRILPDLLENCLTKRTKLIVVCHESNVNGVIQPVREIGAFARKHHLYLMADTAQSAGSVPIHIEEDCIDFLAFTGHKGLLGPAGSGGLILGSRVNSSELRPLKYGGTGSWSDRTEQPDFLPDKYESGTLALPAIAGLQAGIQWVQNRGTAEISQQETRLIKELSAELSKMPTLHLFQAKEENCRGSVLSFTIDGLDNGIAGQRLNDEFGIMTRIGLHCSPMAHRWIGTFPNGTIRFSVSPFTSNEEIEKAVMAVRTLTQTIQK